MSVSVQISTEDNILSLTGKAGHCFPGGGKTLTSCLSDNTTSDIQEALAKKADEYTTTVGSYTAWKTDVNLDSPDPNVQLTKDDEHIHDYYNALQYSLYENNFPETVDRTAEPRTSNPDTGVAITILASPVECLAILLEAGRQCPGDMLLVMSPTWLTKDKSEHGEGLHSLYVKKAIVFGRGGSTFIDVFETPRRCTYFVNFFTRSCTDGQRNDGEELEVELDCPMSSSVDLCKRVDDKLLTRILMAEAGIHYPETLAIVYKPAYEYNVPNDAKIKVICVENKDEVKNNIEKDLRQFINTPEIQQVGRVVVKPSGVSWHGSRCVTFHDVTDFEDILKAVNTLLDILEVENTVLIEAFYATSKSLNEKMDDYSFRWRATVCRKDDDTAVTTQMVCGIGLKDHPINGDNTIPQSLETTLRMWGIDEADIVRLKASVARDSEKLMDAIIHHERSLSVDKIGGIGAQTDLLGIDYVLGEVNGQLEAFGIEVNSHDCTINCQLFEFLNPHRQGESVKPLVETMIKRSQKFSMKNKYVVVVGAGGYSKNFIWDSYKDYGIKVILVDPDETSYGASMASTYVQYDFQDHTQDKDHAINIVQMLNDQGLPIDGCITFWEDCGPLAATIGTMLNLSGPGKYGAEVAKMKSWTQGVLRTKTGDIPHFPRTYLYAGKCYKIETEAEIPNAIEHVGLPAVLKLEYGSSAVGVKPVSDISECINMFRKIKSNLKNENDHPGVGLGHGSKLMLMEFIGGTEHDVDIIIYKRRLVAAFVSDNGPTRSGRFTETTATMPTCLPIDRRGQLITAAYQCCTEIGLIDGVFNVEMKMTTQGPKLIEINARMGGFYLRNWISQCYGVDILFYAFMVSLGIRPVIAKTSPKFQIIGTMCVPSAHKIPLTDNTNLNLLKGMIQTGIVQYNQIEASIEECGHDDDEEPFCNIAVRDTDVKRAKQKLITICNVIGINTKDYDLEYLLKDFVDKKANV